MYELVFFNLSSIIEDFSNIDGSIFVKALNSSNFDKFTIVIVFSWVSYLFFVSNSSNIFTLREKLSCHRFHVVVVMLDSHLDTHVVLHCFIEVWHKGVVSYSFLFSLGCWIQHFVSLGNFNELFCCLEWWVIFWMIFQS